MKHRPIPGQLWKNTKTAVQIQKAEEDNLLAVTFKIEPEGHLKFSRLQRKSGPGIS